jgi:uncharacterized protein
MDLKTMVRLSRFTHFIDVSKEGGMTAIYNSLTQSVMYVSTQLAEALKNIGIQTVECFIEQYFQEDREEAYNLLKHLWNMRCLVEEDEDEMIEIGVLQKVLEKPQIMILYLILTDICNIGCRYCFFEGGIPENYKFSKMSWEIAKKGVDLFARTLDWDGLQDTDAPTIILYGGEALLNWDVALQVLKYVKQLKDCGDLPESTLITLNTNGILITEEIAQNLAEYDVSVAISIDGPKEVHDKMRVDHLGRGTFDSVMKGFDRARKAGCNVSACCTIDEHNLDILPDVTRWFIEDLGVQGLGFNTLLECNARRIPRPVPYSNTVAESLVECFKIARDHGVHEDRFMRKVTAFADGDFYFSDCGGCGMQLVISPDGYVGTCHAYCGTKDYFVKMSELENPVDHPYWVEWRKRSPINMPECYDCIALANCGGGCPHSAAIVTGSIWNVDTSFCPHAKRAVDFLVKDLFNQHFS